MKKAIGREEVEALAKDGRLLVTREMVLTPEARAYATSAGITLEYVAQPPSSAKTVEGADLAKLIEEIVVEELTKASTKTGSVPTTTTKSTDGSALPLQAVPPRADGAPGGNADADARRSNLISESAARDPAVRSQLDPECLAKVLSSKSDEDSSGRAIVTVVGRNRPGVVARISSAVAECGGDLADINQVIIGDYFSMIFIVNLAGLSERNLSFRLFKERLQDEAARLGQVQVLVMHENIFKAMHEV